MLTPIMTKKLTNDPYSTVPCAYLVLERDKMLPRQFQEDGCGAELEEQR